MDALLKVKDLHVYYGMIHAIRGISFEVNRGEIVTLIGANGAGKTTTLHTITGLLPSSGGEVIYNEKNITHVPGYQLVRRGLAHVPEGRRVFSQLSVLQNLELGAFTRRSKEEKAETLKEIYRRFPRLEERKNQLAGTLSGGEQQRVALGRVLYRRPPVVFADEPTGALDTRSAAFVLAELRRLADDGAAVILVTHDLGAAALAESVLIMRDGRIVDRRRGATPDELLTVMNRAGEAA